MTAMTIQTEENTCVHQRAIEALRGTASLMHILDETAERVGRLLTDDLADDEVRVGSDIGTRVRSGWLLIDWRVSEGQVPGEDVTTVTVEYLYRAGDRRIQDVAVEVHHEYPNIGATEIARMISEDVHDYVVDKAASIEILTDDLFLDVLADRLGVSREQLEESYCVEARFASGVITETDVRNALDAEFRNVMRGIEALGVSE